MKTLILAGGRGRRFGALTTACPKPLLPLCGRPILDHLLRNAAMAGLREFVVATGYLGDSIRRCFGDGSRLGVAIEYLSCPSASPEQLVFAFAARWTGETFACFCGDTCLRSEQIAGLRDLHRATGADATILLEPGHSNARHRVRVDEGRIMGSSRRRTDAALTYNFLMQAAVLHAWVEAARPSNDTPLAAVAGHLSARFHLRVADLGPFVNINSPADLARAEALMAESGLC